MPPTRSRAGNYADAAACAAGGEIGHLSLRFEEMTARLAEAEQLERHFLMTVSHELRTPLTAIRGHVAALREGVIEDEAMRAQSLEVVAQETERLERLVGDVLDLAKLEAKRFTLLHEEVDMERLVDRAYATFGEEARRRGIEYERELDGRPVIVADGDRVLQIISNLLANAFRWTPDGGRIDLALRQENGSVHVAVEDTGPGDRGGRAGADLPALLVARRRRHRPRSGDRARARGRPRRPDRARSEPGQRQPLRARAAGATRPGRGCARFGHVRSGRGP